MPLASAALTPADRVRRAANLLNLSTPAGLLVARIGRAPLQRGPHGLLLGEGYRFGFPVAGAFTIGDVILTAGNFEDLLRRHPRLLEHEARHCWQYAACLGLPFLVVYPVAMGWSLLRTGDPASANVFEIHAGLAAGGYHRRPVRPMGVGVRDLWSRIVRTREHVARSARPA